LRWFPQYLNQNVRKRYIAAAGLGLRRLEADAMCFGLLQRLANLSNLSIEIDAVPA
jgi:hypothetical protein